MTILEKINSIPELQEAHNKLTLLCAAAEDVITDMFNVANDLDGVDVALKRSLKFWFDYTSNAITGLDGAVYAVLQDKAERRR